MSGLTMRELVHTLAEALAVYAPAPPPEHVRVLMEAADLHAPDPDLEPGGDDEEGGDDEPSLGWCIAVSGWEGALGGVQDLEAEHDGREPSEDDEPSLGWTSGGCCGPSSDLELEHCGREPEDAI